MVGFPFVWAMGKSRKLRYTLSVKRESVWLTANGGYAFAIDHSRLTVGN